MSEDRKSDFVQCTEAINADRGDVIISPDHCGNNAIIRNNRINDNYGGGIMIQSDSSIIENNIVEYQALVSIMIGPLIAE